MKEIQIEYFMAVAQNLSFTKTAEELFVTQPAISKQIAMLEKELGVILLQRTNKGTELTEAGVLFQRYFEEATQQFKEVWESALAIQEAGRETIRIACLEGWDISCFFPDLVKLFKEKYPHVELLLECYGATELIHALRNDKVDVIMALGVTVDGLDGVEILKLTEIPKILLYSSSDPRARQEGITPASFQNESFFVVPFVDEVYSGRLIQQYCEPYGFSPRVRHVRNIKSMVTCVQNGMGVIISDYWCTEKNHPGFRYLILNEKHDISLVWRSNTKKKEILTLVKELKKLLP